MGRDAVLARTRPIMLPRGLRPALLAMPVTMILVTMSILAATALLPPDAQRLCALAAIIVLGVPHGALDGEIARSLLRSRLGVRLGGWFRWAWFPIFSLPYLLLAAGVLIAWRVTPMPTLAAFLAASAWHFGSEDAPGRHVEAAVRGGLPIAVPLLVHPAATWAVFATVANVARPQMPGWLQVASLLWLVLAVAWTGRVALRGQARLLALPALLVGLFVALPPLTAFAIYFVCLHAPAHTKALVQDARRAPRVRDGRSAIVLALPITALTLAIGAVLWPFYAGAAPDRLLSLTLQGLAALTLPHMLLDALATALLARLQWTS